MTRTCNQERHTFNWGKARLNPQLSATWHDRTRLWHQETKSFSWRRRKQKQELHYSAVFNLVFKTAGKFSVTLKLIFSDLDGVWGLWGVSAIQFLYWPRFTWPGPIWVTHRISSALPGFVYRQSPLVSMDCSHKLDSELTPGHTRGLYTDYTANYDGR